jgi:hypothetical protein
LDVVLWAQITNQSDLKNLCEVSKTLYDVATPSLYESIIIRAPNDSRLEELDVESFMLTGYSNPGSRLQHVRVVQVLVPFYHTLKDRCLHTTLRNVSNDVESDEADQGEGEISSCFAKLANTLMPIFWKMRDDRLRSFR